MNKTLILLGLMILQSSCNRQNVEIKLNVSVKSAEGAPVAEAEVLLNGEKIGDTNAFGTLSKEFDTKKGTVQKIQISKVSAEQYVAPFETELMTPDTKQYTWVVNADLYVVPKPKQRKSQDSIIVQAQTVDSNSEVSVKKESFEDKSTFYLGAKPTTTHLDLSLMQDNTVTPTTIKEVGSTSIKTFHIYSEREPVENAEIWICQSDLKPTLGCVSNSRGRCVVEVLSSKSSDTVVSWLVRKNGYLATQSTIDTNKGTNVRVNLISGKTLEFLTLFNFFGRQVPAENIQVTAIGLTQSSVSNKCGFTVLKSNGLSDSNITIKAVHESIAHSSQEAVLQQSSQGLPWIELIPKSRKAPTIALESLLPGEGVQAADLNRYFSSEALTFRSKFLQASKDTDTSHNAKFVLYRNANNLVLNAAVFEKPKLVWVKDIDVLGTDESLEKPMALAMKLAKEAIAKDQYSNVTVAPKAVVGRWVSLSVTPKPLSAYWDQGVMHVDYQGGPIAVGQATEVKIKAPPGYLDLELKLSSESKWFEVGATKPFNFEPDYLTLAESYASANDYQKTLEVVAKIPLNHTQYKAGLILKAIVLEVVNQLDRPTLEAIAGFEVNNTIDQYNSLVALNYLMSKYSVNNEDKLILAKKMLSVANSVSDNRSISDAFIVNANLFYRAVAKSNIGSLGSDEVMSFDAEADFKEFLKGSEKEAQVARVRDLRVIATKNIENRDAKNF